MASKTTFPVSYTTEFGEDYIFNIAESNQFACMIVAWALSIDWEQEYKRSGVVKSGNRWRTKSIAKTHILDRLSASMLLKREKGSSLAAAPDKHLVQNQFKNKPDV